MGDEGGFIVGSVNVYDDLGFEDPGLELVKAKLARQIVAVIEGRRLTQKQAGQLLGIDQPKVSALVNGRLGRFSAERLIRFLTRLDLDVAITVTPKASQFPAGRVAVYGELEPMAAAPRAKGNGVQFS